MIKLFPFKRSLQNGDRGPEVKNVQEFLLSIGHIKTIVDNKIEKLTADGIFGKITESCVEDYEKNMENYSIELGISVPEDILKYYSWKVDGVISEGTHWLMGHHQELVKFYRANYDYTASNKELVVLLEKVKDLGNSNLLEKKLRYKALEIALKQVGVREEYPYRNTGEMVEEYQCYGSCGIHCYSGWPWCAAFVNYVHKKACEELKINYKGSCQIYTPYMVNEGLRLGITKNNVAAADITQASLGFVSSATRGGHNVPNSVKHVYMIADVSGSNVISIEGNTNPGGSARGYGTFKRTRSIKSVKSNTDFFLLYR